MEKKAEDFIAFIQSVFDYKHINGLTHTYYRYPARFSPRFAEAAIKYFTKPGEIVYDPFMGGGTTLVEAMRLGRRSIGTDINSLAVFVSKLKTTLLNDNDIYAVHKWVNNFNLSRKLNGILKRPSDWISLGYQKNINSQKTWPIRKTLEIALAGLDSLQNNRQRNFVRGLLLKTTQWAIDCRISQPTIAEYREQLKIHLEEMIQGAIELRIAFEFSNSELPDKNQKLPKCLQLSVNEISKSSTQLFQSAPKLILTSPPYPGVHVLYHRWQVKGRKETAAPYWIANCLDEKGASFYTFGDRKQKRLENYFETMRKCYMALSTIADKRTWLVQLVAFSSPKWQLPLFLQILKECGFDEVTFNEMSHLEDNRSWRRVPNRKFYADRKGDTSSSNEVLLIHRHK